MTTKLTLTIDQRVMKSAKHYAQEKGAIQFYKAILNM